jgi:hypothetical protein
VFIVTTKPSPSLPPDREKLDGDVVHRMDDVGRGHDLPIRRDEDARADLTEADRAALGGDVTPLRPDHDHGDVHRAEHVADGLREHRR